MKKPKVIPITRGKRSHLKLTVNSGASSVQFVLQPTNEPVDAAAWSRQQSERQNPGELLQFESESQKGRPKVNSYTIDADNRVHAGPETSEGAAFASAEDLEQLVAGWPMRRLVDVWNGLPGVRPVARFENRKVGVQRIWQELQAEAPASAPQRRQSGSKRKRQVRESKLHLVLRMLQEPEGATLEDLMKATRWQAHSVRGFLSGKVSKQLALPLESFRRDGARVYRLSAAQ
jgi:hypothetical protein